MTRRLATNYAKNYCNRTLIVKVIVENVVTCFLGGYGVQAHFTHLSTTPVVCAVNVSDALEHISHITDSSTASVPTTNQMSQYKENTVQYLDTLVRRFLTRSSNHVLCSGVQYLLMQTNDAQTSQTQARHFPDTCQVCIQ